MFELITLIFLTAQVALVLGIMTKEDLPVEIQNCLDNVVLPRIRLRASCKLANDENAECQPNSEEKETHDENSKCLLKIDELPLLSYKFTRAYMINENMKTMKYDFSSELPENVRNCIDSIKPILQADFQSAKDCEDLIVTDNPNPETPDPYEECMDKIPNVYENPQALKCIDMVESLDEKQRRFANPYAFRVIFDL